jgi:integrase
MPRIKLTQLAAERLNPPPAEHEMYWDTQLPGFGLRISARDRRTWVCLYRVRGANVMASLGTMATIPSVSNARELARQAMRKAAAGIDPRAERRAAEEAARAEEAVEAFTFADLVERFIREHAERNTKATTAYETRRILTRARAAGWEKRPAASIGKADVNLLVEDIASGRLRRRGGAKGGALVEANAVLRCLRTCFRWAAAKDLVGADPTAGVLKPLVREVARDRVLGDDEITWFWSGTELLGWPFGPIARLLLVTAQRESEVAGMRRSELDLDRRTWTIPGERAKNGKAHVVHLNDLVIETIEAVPNLGDLLFSSNGQRPVSGFSNAKERLDRFMSAAGGDEAVIEGWRWHDLRRTATTGMARLSIAPHVADKVLNHTTGTIRGVAAVYNRHAYLDERRAALDAWGRFVEGLVRPEHSKDNVVPLRSA